ncbi:uncharacterized protein LOC135648284 [Musa acuminata AAA Group]|uniref:(wild Malaysian banana) hypothetical protein n=1 Tax=Musa acuminata subsp. malaccensis TaxID=214687 RepID=A0A804KMZ4_MUSAM|nr:PREDICTED: uncharacterized protein LOC103998749 [Musa acuminata subsp. malaccensis]CAG1836266.1 unnamed protein product [Musa acuminata subsp. malaccensis]
MRDRSRSDRNKRRCRSPSASAGKWADLLDPLLLSVLDRLPSLRDRFAVASVCRTWRAVSRPSLSSATGSCPPLLFRLFVGPFHRRSRRCHQISPRRCDLLCPAAPFAPSRSVVSSGTLNLFLLGCSYGHLIFCKGRRAILADIFTGDELRSPDLPSDGWRFHYGALTGSLSSPGSNLLLSANGNLLRWRIGDSKWEECSFTPLDVHMERVVAFKDHVFALDSAERLRVLQFSPYFSIKQMAVEWAGRSIYSGMNIGFTQQLVECGGELMLVQVIPAEQIMHLKFEVYRLDLSGQPTWVKVDGLGDWALFIEESGRCPASCPCPGRWGGRSNCIYYAGHGRGRWHVFSLDDTSIDTTDPESPLYFDNQCVSKWPSPLWVYPSMLY